MKHRRPKPSATGALIPFSRFSRASPKSHEKAKQTKRLKKTPVTLPPIQIISDDEAEAVDYLVCVPWGTPSPFDDNLKGVCCKCGITIMYRWHAPRKPKRICLECMVKLETKIVVESETTKGEL